MPATTLTLAANTNYNLLLVLQGVTAGIAAKTNPNYTPSCRLLNLQSDPANGAAKVFLGDSNISAANALTLLNGDVYYDESGNTTNAISLADKYLRADTINTRVNVLWEYA